METTRKYAPLQLGPEITIWPPVVLAPMAGVTNYPYRKICSRFGAGLCVSEMVSSRGILERHKRTWQLAHFGAAERPRSIQIFGCDPYAMSESAKILKEEFDVDHIDINFGCPVNKLVKKGMGAAVPADPDNCRRVVSAVVRAADPIPVTIKVRLGLDSEKLTYHEAGRIAEEEGCQWIAVHGRTAAQKYSGRADWGHIAELKERLSLPVLGNGDIFTAADAIRRMEETGVDGVVIGRGCLGNPWLFRDLVRAFEGQEPAPRPEASEVVSIVREHYQLLRDHFEEAPRGAILRMRKFGAWYATEFPGSAEFRRSFQRIEDEEDLERLLDRWLEACASETRDRTESP